MCRIQRCTLGSFIEGGGFAPIDADFFAPDSYLCKILLDRKVAAESITGGVLQMKLTAPQIRRISVCALQCDVIRCAASSVFGTDRFEVSLSSCRKLSHYPSSAVVASIPHVDDTSVEELFCIVHLKPGQTSTMGVPVSLDDLKR